MKRNLFVILLAVMLVAAVVFAVTPDAKANSGLITVQEDGETITVSAENTVLNLNGKKNVVVKIENGVKLSVIDTSFMVDAETLDLTGANAGTLTVDAASTGTIAPVAFDGNFRYLAVAENGTYSFHPFNLAISKLGINTIGEAVCIRVTFIANDVVKGMLTDYGIKGVSGEAATHSAKENYTFGSSNGMQAYFDLKGSFDADKLDVTCKYQAYMVVNGVDVLSNYVVEITPREILKTLNKSGLTPTDNQKAAIEALAANNAHLTNLFTSVTGAQCTHTAKAALTCVAPETCKDCDLTFAAANRLIGHADADRNGLCDYEGCASIVTTPNNHTHVLLNNGAVSDAWEITGTMLRPTGSPDQWNFGFDIYDENGNALVFSATSGGIVFERVQGQYTRYPYHMNLSQYNIDTTCAGFHKGNNANDTMYFKAVIENDVFYAWFGYTEETMVLSWMIPLTQELTGRWGSDLWTTFNDSSYAGDDKSIPFPGFASGSKYSVAMHVNATPSASGSINDIVTKTGADVTTKVAPKFLANLNRNFASMDYINGTLVTKPGVLNQIELVGDSKTWDMSGTIKRNGTEPLNFGFMIQSGNKTLRMSAVTEGVLFEAEEHSGHGRYPYHAMSGVTKYNLNPAISKFLKATEKDSINFKAAIADDTFYVWFWFDGEQPTLSWVVPLTETLVGTDAHSWTVDNSGEYSGAFTGFAPDSSYKMNFYVKATSSTANVSNLTVKTNVASNGFIPNKAQNATVDISSGVINNIPSGGNVEVPLYGASNAWEITGAVERLTNNDNLNFGFMLSAGGKSLRVSAVTSGPVFESHAGHGRYAYHAIIGLGSTTQYNLNTNVNAFLAAKTQSKMYFKALIAGDMFYVWFWYEGEQPTLSWVIPLTETLCGVPGGNVWTDNPFTGFAPGSEYSVAFFTNNTAASGRFSGLEVKTGNDVTTEAPDYAAVVKSGTVDSETGKITSAPAQITNIDFAGNSQTWEISGTMSRPDKVGTLSFMFNLRSGNKTLNITAASSGIVFGEDGTASGYTREPYHCFGPTQYNLRPINEFLTAKKAEMHFKVLIANDTFYAYFWYEGEEPQLAWQIPLAEQLYGPNGAAWTGGSPFMGFDAGSSYILNFRVRAGADAAISNLTVKTGANVDTSILPADEA